jgi:hypothetical protein
MGEERVIPGIRGYNRQVISSVRQENKMECAAWAHTGGAKFYRRLM